MTKEVEDTSNVGIVKELNEVIEAARQAKLALLLRNDPRPHLDKALANIYRARSRFVL